MPIRSHCFCINDRSSPSNLASNPLSERTKDGVAVTSPGKFNRNQLLTFLIETRSMKSLQKIPAKEPFVDYEQITGKEYESNVEGNFSYLMLKF